MTKNLAVITRAPRARQWLEDLARDRARCKAEGHLHPPTEMSYDPVSKRVILDAVIAMESMKDLLIQKRFGHTKMQ